MTEDQKLNCPHCDWRLLDTNAPDNFRVVKEKSDPHEKVIIAKCYRCGRRVKVKYVA